MAKPKAAKKPGGVVTIMPPPKPGEPGNAGKPKGATAFTTRNVKAMILEALEAAGGKDYLLYHALMNPQLFMPLVGKVLPLTVAGDPNEPLNVVHHYVQRKSVPAPKKKK